MENTNTFIERSGEGLRRFKFRGRFNICPCSGQYMPVVESIYARAWRDILPRSNRYLGMYVFEGEVNLLLYACCPSPVAYCPSGDTRKDAKTQHCSLLRQSSKKETSAWSRDSKRTTARGASGPQSRQQASVPQVV